MQKRLAFLLPSCIIDVMFQAVESVQNLSVIFHCDFYFKMR